MISIDIILFSFFQIIYFEFGVVIIIFREYKDTHFGSCNNNNQPKIDNKPKTRQIDNLKITTNRKKEQQQHNNTTTTLEHHHHQASRFTSSCIRNRMSENQNAQSLPSIEQATAEFQAGVTAALRSWSALRTAVNSEWGGIMSRDKAEYLRSYIIENLAYTLPNPKLDIDSLEDNLAIFMEEEFSIVLEDESEKQLAQLIFQMYQSCGKGDYSLSRQIVSDSMKSQNSNEKVTIQCDSDDDSDNEMVDTNTLTSQSDQDQYLFGIPQSVLEENRSNQSQTNRQPKPEPIVDDDGFTLVAKR